jgi:ribosome recycling factor
MNPILSEFKQHTTIIIDTLKEELKSIRTGRATPALVEGVAVEAYGGTPMKLLELAAITTEGPAIIVIAPFDPSTVSDIERAIQKSALGFTPAVNGNTIRIAVPPMSQEQREKYTKLIGQMVEEKRESVRGNRDEARKQIKQGVDAKELTEDDKFRLEKEIDEATQKVNEEIHKIRESKERELMEV